MVEKKRFPVLETVFCALLAIYPADFRGSNSAEMIRVLRDELDRQHRGHGYRGALKSLLVMILDLVANAWLVRRDSFNQFGHMRGAAADDSPKVHSGGKVKVGEMLYTLWQDIRFGGRMLIKHPGVTIVAALALALGVGANTAIFSVVNTVLLRPLPFKDPDRLLVVSESKLPQFPEIGVAQGNFSDWRAQNTVFEQIEAYGDQSFNLSDRGDTERVYGTPVSAGLFHLLGIAPIIGRDFLVEEDRPGHGDVVILSHRLWLRRFAGDPAVVGRNIDLNGKAYNIIGAIGPGVRLPYLEYDIYVPQALDERMAQDHRHHTIGVLARLKPNVTIEQANAEMSAISHRLGQQYPETNAGWGVRLRQMQEYEVAEIKPALVLLLGAVALVLLIACANVANLLLAKATGRHKEIAIRLALGAGRWRIIRQLLTESLLLALVGGGFGLLLARFGMNAMLALAPDGLPGIKDVTVDGRALGFTFLITILTGLIFGLAPALQVSKPNLEASLKDGSRGSTNGGRLRVRNALVVAEIGLSLVLLMGAGLLIKSFVRLQRVNPGFEPRDLLTATINFPTAKYSNAQQAAFCNAVIKQTAGLPGVQSVGATDTLPFRDGSVRLFTIEGRPPLPGQDLPTDFYVITPAYFQAMGIPLLRGRAFDEHDTGDSSPVVIVDEEMARRYFPGEDPIGQRLQILRQDKVVWREIVGIVGNVRQIGLNTDRTVQSYTPYTQPYTSYIQQPASEMTLVIRTGSSPAAATATIRNQTLSGAKDKPISSVQPMEQFISDSIARERFTMVLLGLFSAVALVLAAVGIYGVMSYQVTQRTHEVGIRLALGAQTGDVLRLVVGQGMFLAGIGIVAGALGAFVLAKILAHEMSSLLFSVSATDPLILGCISLLLALIALLACYLPARRAARIDPLLALRYE